MANSNFLLVDPLQVIGTDPGSVNFGLCHINFKGFLKDNDKNEYYPLVDILNWELWNVKQQTIVRFDPLKDEKYSTVDYADIMSKLNLPKQYEDDGLLGGSDINMTYLTSSLNTIISKTNWLFEPYTSALFKNKATLPMLATEIQCGHLKNINVKTGASRMDILLLSRILPSSINYADLINRQSLKNLDDDLVPYEREIIHKLQKYGVSNDAYEGRKQDSIDVTEDLLQMLGLDDARTFLKKLVKIDDLCDAFLIAIQTAIDYWQGKNSQIYIIHKKHKTQTPMKTIKNECSSCKKVIVKQVHLDYKLTKRKVKCFSCKKGGGAQGGGQQGGGQKKPFQWSFKKKKNKSPLKKVPQEKKKRKRDNGSLLTEEDNGTTDKKKKTKKRKLEFHDNKPTHSSSLTLDLTQYDDDEEEDAATAYHVNDTGYDIVPWDDNDIYV